MRDRVLKVLEEIRPMLRTDGGDIELVEVSEEGIVKVRFKGFCDTCQDSMMSLKQGLERLLREQVPGIREVRTVDPKGS